MFLFAFKGAPDQRAAFHAVLDRHAAWLDLRKVKRGDVVWLGAAEAPPPWFAGAADCTRAALFEPPREASFSCDAPIIFDVTLDGLRVEVPLVTPEQAYYVADKRGVAVGNDLRPLAAWAGFEIEPLAAAGFLQYGMVPSPYTLIRNIHRVPSGFSLDSRSGSEPTVRRETPPVREWTTPVDDADPVGITTAHLDRNLESTPDGAVVFFSGGTDSGLIAARLAARNRDDVQLVNYSFGVDDEDSLGAEAFARELGLTFHRIEHDEIDLPRLFDRIGADSIFPFNDLSVIPTNRMLHATRELLSAGCAALLGVGADDIYDGGLKIRSWTRVGGFPRPLRALAVAALGVTRPWWRDDRSRRLWGILRRSLSASHPLGAPIMHNDLAGIGYPFDGIQPMIEAAWRDVYDPFFKGLPLEDRMALVFLINGGMGWEAPKFDPLRRFGVRARYPFLDGPMLRHGLSLSWQQKCEGTKEKILLKRMLGQSVPGGIVERPKRGFTPPYGGLLRREDLQQRVRAAFRHGPLAFACNRRFLEEALDRARGSRVPNRGVLNLVWSIFFASTWIEQTRDALTPDRDPRSG